MEGKGRKGEESESIEQLHDHFSTGFAVASMLGFSSVIIIRSLSSGCHVVNAVELLQYMESAPIVKPPLSMHSPSLFVSSISDNLSSYNKKSHR
jgi:hypothetical protein